jgi:D-alanyl-D-alanine carboxypeptidase
MAPDALIGRSPRSRPRRFPALGAVLLICVVSACSSSDTVTPPGTASFGGTGQSSQPAQATRPGSSPVPSASLGVSPPPGPTPSGPPASQDPGASPPGPDAGGLDAGTRAALQAILDHARQQNNVPAISVAVLLADGRSWVGVSGDRQLSPAKAADGQTEFAIASITKTFVTAVIMQLVDEGKLSLGDHLDTWLSDVPNAAAITIRELLGHTSGVYNYFENPHYNDLVFNRRSHRWTFNEIIGLVRHAYCAPGGCYHYSNTNFVLLGRVAELVTGKSIAELVRRRLLDPFGLKHTSFQPDEPTSTDRAHAYLYGTDWTRSSPVLPMMSAATVAWAAGAMVSTPADLARWARLLYTGQVVSQALLDQMLSVRKCHDNYGLGTRWMVINGRAVDGHLGSLRGYNDAMWYFPREGATIVLLSNQGAWSPDATIRHLSTTLFDRIGAPAPQYDPSRNTRVHDGVTLYC